MAKIAAGQTDKYANVILVSVLESAANTLTFEELPQVTTLMEKKAFLINRVSYSLGAVAMSELKADGERLNFGLSMSNRWTAPTILEPTIIDYQQKYTTTLTAVGFQVMDANIKSDFSTLPGGGILIPTRPIYFYAQGVGLANACTITAKIYFTIVELSPADYWDLVESMQAYS